jgi:hypothetical protein
MFKVLGIAVLAYTAYAAMRGEVYAKSGAWGRVVSRAESPDYFWIVLAIYTALGIALLTVF